MLNLSQAAVLTGTSTTKISQAIREGRLSARRRSDRSYEIDPQAVAIAMISGRSQHTERAPQRDRTTSA